MKKSKFFSLTSKAFLLSVILVNSCSREKKVSYSLQNPVHVIIDRCGTPHIFAEDDKDAFFVFGYIQAHYRLFQMDLSRREAMGKLAEIFPDQLTQDIINRMLSFKLMAEISKDSFEKTGMLKKIQAFVDGINKYIEDAKAGREFGGIKARIPLQYQALKIEPEPFYVEDVIAVGKKRAFDLAGGGLIDLASKLIQLVFGENFEEKFSISSIEKVSVVDDLPKTRLSPFGNNENIDLQKLKSAIEKISEKVKGLKNLLSLNSNNFVVSGRITKYGYPILENDPHLAVISPSTFFPFQINSPQYSGFGFTFPGIPIALVGGGKNVCWGVTTTLIDAMDIIFTPIIEENGKFFIIWGKRKLEVIPREEEIFYFENGEKKSKKIKFLFVPNIGIVLDAGNKEGFSSIIPYLFGIAGAPGVEESISKILKYVFTLGMNVDRKEAGNLGIVLIWTGYKPTSEFAAFYETPSAEDIFSAMIYYKFFQTGIQNFIVADIKGNIGYFPHGEIPIRPSGTKPYLPDLSENLFWLGNIEPDFIPRAVNPQSGYIVTANNDIIGTSFDNNPLNERFYLGPVYDFGFRAKRISEMIEENRGKIDKFVAATIINDVTSPLARRFVKVLLNFVSEKDIENLDADENKKKFMIFILNKLKNWNFEEDVNSFEPLAYEMIMQMSFSNFAWKNFSNNYVKYKFKDIIFSALKGTDLESLAGAIYDIGSEPLTEALFQLSSDPQVIIRSVMPILQGEKGTLCDNKEGKSLSDERFVFLGEDGCPKDEFLSAISKTADYLIENAKICKRKEGDLCAEFLCKDGLPENCVLGDFSAKRFSYIADIPGKENFEAKYFGSLYFRKSGGTALVYASDIDTVELDKSSKEIVFKKPITENEFVAFQQGEGGQTLKYICEAKPEGVEIWYAIPGGVADDPSSPYFANMITAWACAREWLKGVTQGYCSIPKDILPEDKDYFKIIFSKLETDFEKLISSDYHTSPLCNQREIYLIFR